MSYSSARYYGSTGSTGRPSIATTADSSSRTRNKKKEHEGVDGDSVYVEECRRLQQLIQTIQTQTSTINKIGEAGYPEGWRNGNHQKDIHEQMEVAKTAAREAQTLLRRFGDITGGSAAEKSQRRLMHQKLYHNYQTALKSLESAAQRTVQIGSAGQQQFGNISSTHRHFLHFSQEDGVSTITSAYSSTAQSIWSTDSAFDSIAAGQVSAPSSALYRPSPPPQQVDGQAVRYLMPIMINSQELEVEMMRERQEQIQQIETDIEGIHDLYRELSCHVGTQGADIDNIESQMRQAAEHTESATQQVQRARDSQRTRTRRLSILICASLLGAMVVVLLLLKVLKVFV
eukprot:GHVS01108695.1.p1 GENE.GHVS01108695.1~~GHVS01108695.1.p1  ORF type:complete len:344 (-),score=56.66 GHVS01108695.1:122-1153(-)